MSLGAQTSLRDLMQPSQLDRLLRGQQRLEVGMDDLRRGMERLVDVVDASAAATRTQNFAAISSQVERKPSHVLHKEKSDLTQFSHMDSLPLSTTSTCEDGDYSANIRPTLPNMASNVSVSNRKAHAIFESLVVSMARSNYARVENLGHGPTGHTYLRDGGGSHGSLVDMQERPSWHHTKRHFLIHPASRVCTVLDCLRAIFLVHDLVMVPYALAWELDYDGWVYALGLCVVSFWSVELLLNFCTGFMIEGRVEMNFTAIAKQYFRRGFLVDFLALGVECVDLAVQRLANVSSGSLQLFKVLRFFKVTRLVRIVAKLREGLLARLSGTVSYLIQVHGLHSFQVSLDFVGLLLKLLFVIAWLGHVGACLWYGLDRTLRGNGSETWRNEFHDSTANAYQKGLYWSVSTMFSGASYLKPINTPEIILANLWLVMGAMFVTCITSTLAATLIASHEKHQENSKKVQALAAFMAQRKTPVLLSLSVQANFHQKLLAPKHLTELDLPFLNLVKPSLRAALREDQYAVSFLRSPFFRMLSAVQEGILQPLAFDAAAVSAVLEGESIFKGSEEMTHTFLLNHGRMKYSTMSGVAKMASEATPTAIASAASVVVDAVANEQVVTITPETVTWICELSLLLPWTTVGSLGAAAPCELLLVSAEHFVKLVSGNPGTAAVVAEYAVQCRKLLQENDIQCTDIDSGVDADTVASTMHRSIRGGLVSRPILDMLRRHQRMRGLLMRKDFCELEAEVMGGLSHLVLGPDGPSTISRVVRVAVLRLTNHEGLVLTQLGHYNAHCEGKVCLPGCKILGHESPNDALKRLTQEQLHIIADGIRIVDVQIAVEYEFSHSYGFLRTKYIKYIHDAELDGRLEKDITLPPPMLQRINSETSKRSGASGAVVPHESSSTSKDSRKVATFTKLSSVWMKSETNLGRAHRTHSAHAPILGSPPFPSEGPTPSFAVQESIAGGETPPFLGTPVRVYRWLQAPDFHMLLARRIEVESELTPIMRGLTFNDWHTLLSWRLTPDRKVPVIHESADENGLMDFYVFPI